MSRLDGVVLSLERDLANKVSVEKRVESLKEEHLKVVKNYEELLAAGKLISALADRNSLDTLDYITGVINRTLGELFKQDARLISLSKTLYAGKHAHINVELIDLEGNKYNIALQSGNGLQEVVSFLFAICLISINGGRKIFVQDEILGGTHGVAKKVIAEIIKLFAKDFQFVMIEYGFDTIGKIYSVEKLGKVSSVIPLGEELEYDPNAVFQRPKGASSATENANLEFEVSEEEVV